MLTLSGLELTIGGLQGLDQISSSLLVDTIHRDLIPGVSVSLTALLPSFNPSAIQHLQRGYVIEHLVYWITCDTVPTTIMGIKRGVQP